MDQVATKPARIKAKIVKSKRRDVRRARMCKRIVRRLVRSARNKQWIIYIFLRLANISWIYQFTAKNVQQATKVQ